MLESINEFFTNGEFWPILIKALITTLLTAGVGFICTQIGKAIAKNKESKICKYAEKCVKAAEMKYPNEGTKMGPQKMAYVMDQLAIKFPKIKENTYLYNIAEAAVFELNKENEKSAAIKEFEDKYGEKPLAILDEEETISNNVIIEENTITISDNLTSIENDNSLISNKNNVSKSLLAKINDVKTKNKNKSNSSSVNLNTDDNNRITSTTTNNNNSNANTNNNNIKLKSF